MKEKFLRWLQIERARIVHSYPSSMPLVNYLVDFFSSNDGSTIFQLLQQASWGHGFSIGETNSYILEKDMDEGDILEGAEFYFAHEFDGRVDIPTYISVLELVSSAYVKFYPEERENILALLEKVKARYNP